MSEQERKQSIFYKMRLFHNWVKKGLLEKYARGIEALLDFCSGKGGDLRKWTNLDIKLVIGYDINEESVLEARRRLAEIDSPSKIVFHVLDLSRLVIPELPVKFNVVTSMFAFHYMFESVYAFDTIMKSIENNLAIGGYFIGCLFDQDEVLKLVGSGYKSDDFYVKFEGINLNRPFGNATEVFIKETVLDKPTNEYLVNFHYLTEALEARGFTLVETSMFSELYGKWQSKYNQMSELEQRISFLNRFFVFQRVR